MLVEFENSISQYDVTSPQFMILKVIHEGTAATPGAISEVIGVDMGAVTRLIDRLVKKGLLKRRPCTEDRRVCYVDLTDKSRKLMPKLTSAADKNNEKFLAALSAQDLDKLHGYLRKIIEV